LFQHDHSWRVAILTRAAGLRHAQASPERSRGAKARVSCCQFFRRFALLRAFAAGPAALRASTAFLPVVAFALTALGLFAALAFVAPAFRAFPAVFAAFSVAGFGAVFIVAFTAFRAGAFAFAPRLSAVVAVLSAGAGASAFVDLMDLNQGCASRCTGCHVCCDPTSRCRRSSRAASSCVRRPRCVYIPGFTLFCLLICGTVAMRRRRRPLRVRWRPR
jgi:hypothetical protein